MTSIEYRKKVSNYSDKELEDEIKELSEVIRLTKQKLFVLYAEKSNRSIHKQRGVLIKHTKTKTK